VLIKYVLLIKFILKIRMHHQYFRKSAYVFNKLVRAGWSEKIESRSIRL